MQKPPAGFMLFNRTALAGALERVRDPELGQGATKELKILWIPFDVSKYEEEP